MEHVKYLILGAGPSGLAMANRLLQRGEEDFLLIEKENRAGGLCRSEEVDGSPFDIGGGHFLDVKKENVLEFLFNFMPKSEWKLFQRNSQIQLDSCMINNPMESNIWQMNLEKQVEYIKDIAVAGCNLNQDKPDNFIDWITWKLGRKIAMDYMLPYNQKMFGDLLNELGTYWLDKLPNVSFEDTLMSCLTHKPYGKQPAHAMFYYPLHYGYGELWKRMEQKIIDKIRVSMTANKIDFTLRTVNDCFQADHIIVTIPWCEFNELVGISDTLVDHIQSLKYSSIVTEYNLSNLDSDAHWNYYPNLELDYHRILLRHNFCDNAQGHWTETNLSRYKEKVNCEKSFHYVNKYAYPLNTIDKPYKIAEILEWAKSKHVYGLGRWGEWQHFNSDVVVERAMNMADDLLKSKDT